MKVKSQNASENGMNLKRVMTKIDDNKIMIPPTFSTNHGLCSLCYRQVKIIVHVRMLAYGKEIRLGPVVVHWLPIHRKNGDGCDNYIDFSWVSTGRVSQEFEEIYSSLDQYYQN
mmetsp:Transcript_10397/g.14680  ORF Transcript_10397/g.14680 Transcript_10397/m.14680 type:complete len:114 (-) Transcript_10397:66-407(-)